MEEGFEWGLGSAGTEVFEEKVSGEKVSEKVSVLSFNLFDWVREGSGVELCAWEEIRELNLRGLFIEDNYSN